jgi:FkbM family methyltransferase
MTSGDQMFVRSKYFHRKLRGLALRVLYWIENDNNVDFASNGEECFIDATTSYFAKLENTQLEIFDIGANRGDYTQILLEKLSRQELNARINVFEPTTSCFRLLTNRYASSANVILNQTAVSNASGSLQIYYDREESALASLHQRNLSSIGISLNQSETVQTLRLDTYIKAKRITHIHLLKIDIEGHEIAAFEGMGEYLSGDFVDFIQFEYGGANLDSKTSLMDFYALLESRGFVVGKLMPRGVELRTYKPWMENFQYANYAAISRRVAEKFGS